MEETNLSEDALVIKEVEIDRKSKLRSLTTGNSGKDMESIISTIETSKDGAKGGYVIQKEILQSSTLKRDNAYAVLKIFEDFLVKKKLIITSHGNRLYSERVAIFLDQVAAYRDAYGLTYKAILEELQEDRIKENLFFTPGERLIEKLNDANRDLVADVINSITESIGIQLKNTLALEDKTLNDSELKEMLSSYIEEEKRKTAEKKLEEQKKEEEQKAREEEHFKRMEELLNLRVSNEIQQEIDAARIATEEAEEKNKELELKIKELEAQLQAKTAEKEEIIANNNKQLEEIALGLKNISDATSIKGFGAGKAIKNTAAIETRRMLDLIKNS